MRGDRENKTHRDRFSQELLMVLVNDLLRVNPPGLVDLLEQEESCVFRFPAKQK